MANEVTVATLRTNTWKSIYTILNNYKLNGTIVYAGFPNKSPSFPCYIIQPALVPSTDVTLGHAQDYEISVEIEFWVLANDDRKEKIDEMKDNVMNTFITYTSVLEAQNLTTSEDWFNDDMVETVMVNNEKYHTGSVTLKLRLLK